MENNLTFASKKLEENLITLEKRVRNNIKNIKRIELGIISEINTIRKRLSCLSTSSNLMLNFLQIIDMIENIEKSINNIESIIDVGVEEMSLEDLTEHHFYYNKEM